MPPVTFHFFFGEFTHALLISAICLHWRSPSSGKCWMSWRRAACLTAASTTLGPDRAGLADQARFLKRQLSLPVSTMSQWASPGCEGLRSERHRLCLQRVCIGIVAGFLPCSSTLCRSSFSCRQSTVNISAAACSPDCTAPSILPFQSGDVSVPAQCTDPIGARRSGP
jgi:hypothetical protein